VLIAHAVIRTTSSRGVVPKSTKHKVESDQDERDAADNKKPRGVATNHRVFPEDSKTAPQNAERDNENVRRAKYDSLPRPACPKKPFIRTDFFPNDLFRQFIHSHISSTTL
jgi:hypothetical protein